MRTAPLLAELGGGHEFNHLDSLGRIHGRPAGLKELRHCLHARYGDGADREWKIFRIVPVGNENAEERWAKLAKKWTDPDAPPVGSVHVWFYDVRVSDLCGNLSAE